MRSILAIPLALALAGCDSPTGAADVRGVFVLASIAGNPLPTPHPQDPEAVIVEAGEINFAGSGSCSMDHAYRYPPEETATHRPQTCTYLVTDELVIVRVPGDAGAEVAYQFAREGDVLTTFDNSGSAWLYQRQ